jgi:hypothetical protein
MQTFRDYNEALIYANRISAERLVSITIVQRVEDEYIVCDNGSNDRQAHDHHIMMVTNFDSPYELHYKSPKSGQDIAMFPTREKLEQRYKEMVKDTYYFDISKKMALTIS